MLGRGYGGRDAPRKVSFVATLVDTMNFTDIIRGIKWN